MAFSFGATGSTEANAELGPELPDLFTDEVGFKGVESDCNVRLLPSPWPSDALPAPTCSLLAIAPTKGIVVGAGPDSLVVANSAAVRQAIAAPTEDKVKTKPFQPQATIPVPARPTHVAFVSGDEALVLATENGTHLVVFEAASLLQGNSQPAASIPTNGVSLRAVVPNPAAPGEATAAFVALVTTNGELLIADLKAGNLVTGPNGPVLKTEVSYVCWSNRGKQLVAGIADGTGYQMAPDGTKKDEIPCPSDLEPNCHVSSIAWLENDIFLMVYTPNSAEDDMGQNPASHYYIITRRKQAPFLIQKLPELCSPLGGYNRTPAFQFIARLRDFKPSLKDVLIVSSTASSDVGIITRSEQPLGSDDSATQAVGKFTTTEVNDDTKKASLPLKDSVDETSAIGLGVDLSSSENVASPIPGEALPESSTPLPNILLLNNEGILSSWWFIYAESIRQKLPYSGLVSVGQQQPQQPQPQPQPQQQQQPSFGQPAFGTPSPMGASPFGQPSAPAFGATSTLGIKSAPGLGQLGMRPTPSFGTSSQPGSTFGAPSALGRAAPQFGQSGFGAMGAASAFGQPSMPGQGAASLPFGTPSATSGGGFGSFAKSGGFSGFAAAQPSGQSPFAKPAVENPFGKPAKPLPFGSTDTETAFTRVDESKSLSSGGFVLGSTFKADGTAATDGPKPEKPSAFSFGTNLDEMLTSPNKPSTPMEGTDDMEPEPIAQPGKPAAIEPAPSGPAPSLFGAQPQPEKPAAPAEPSKPAFSLFGNIPTEKPAPGPLSPPSERTTVASTTPKQEPREAVEAPLPPDSTSKAVYGPGDTSSSNVSKSSVEEAPLPPDFTTPSKPTPKEEEAPLPPDFTKPAKPVVKAEEAPLPPDFTKPSKPAPEAEEAPLPPDFTKLSKPAPEAEEAPLPPDFTKPSKPAPEAEEAPLPPDFTAPSKPVSKEQEPEAAKTVHEEAPLPPDPAESKEGAVPEEETGPVPEESDAEESAEDEDADESDEEQDDEESDFADSGEEITHDTTEDNLPSSMVSPETSFGGLSDKRSSGSLFGRISKPEQKQQPRQLFGEISKPKTKPEPPSPPYDDAKEHRHRRSTSQGKTLAAVKLTGISRKPQRPSRRGISPEQARMHLQAQRREEEEELVLSDDDEDERLRADLALPLEPVPTLDPFLPHQDYMGDTSKPGIPGQIERLYRDMNSMVDTLGINARSLASFLLYQKTTDSNFEEWMDKLKGKNPASVLEQELRLVQIDKFGDALDILNRLFQEHKVDGVEEKLEQCREILSRDVMTLRGQCASIRKTLDAHTDAVAIRSAPLSAEQVSLQQDLRTVSTDIQAKLVDLEQKVSLLRAKIAEIPRPDGANGSRQTWKRPTMEQVASTISTMMNMAETKSSDIDVLEVQLRRMGLDVAAPPSHREASPFSTPKKASTRFPITPGSRGSLDGPLTAYHTPESARMANLRSSVNESARMSRFRNVGDIGDMVTRDDTERWKTKAQRRKYLVGSLKTAIGEKKSKVRGVDDL